LLCLETADTERLADLIEAFLASEDQAMRDAFVMGLVRSFGVAPDDYATALQRVRDQQRRFHEGYEPRDIDLHDLALLHRLF
jgi:hypothetical protein